MRGGDTRVSELLHQKIDGLFAVPQQEEPGRFVLQNLRADLRADRPASAGDEYFFAPDGGADFRHVELDRLSAQKVLKLDRAEPAHLDLSAGKIVHAWQDAHFDAQMRERLEISSHFDAACGGDGDERHLYLPLLRDSRQVVFFAEHAESRDDFTLFPLVFVDETERQKVARSSGQVACQIGPRFTRPDDQGFLAFLLQALLGFAGELREAPGGAGSTHEDDSREQDDRQ